MIMQKLSKTMMLLMLLVLAVLANSLPVDNSADTGEINGVGDGQSSDVLLVEKDPGQNDLGWKVQEGQESLQHYPSIVDHRRRKRQTYPQYSWYQPTNSDKLSNLLYQSMSNNKPYMVPNGAGDYGDRNNWQLGGRVQLAVPLWQSKDGNTVVGAGAEYSQTIGKYQGNFQKLENPDYGVRFGILRRF